ncbi:MAG: hypothetical protein R3C69_16560 [Geminicoccaceae bacterium]
MSRLLGITVMPEWIQAEGIDRVLDNLQMAGANAVGTSPYVMAPSDDPAAGREPPIDAGAGKVRLLDRDLWGKRELRCVTAPSFAPDTSLYQGLRYQPAAASELTEREGWKVGDFIEAAQNAASRCISRSRRPFRRATGCSSAGRRTRQPLLPDGSTHVGRVDKNGSLAAPEIVAYLEALLQDVAKAYPTVDAVRLDWPEYPPYTLDAWLFDFSAHAERAALAKGYDFAALRELAGRYQREPARFLADGLAPLAELGRFKADLAVDLLGRARAVLPADTKLVAHAFPPPWNELSGLDFARVGAIADDIAVKLYTMHWPMMLKGYLERMGRLDAAGAVAIQKLFDTGDAPLEALRYPEPQEAHPVGAEAQARKIRAAAAAAPSIHAAAHAYGPLDDVLARARVAWEASNKRIWLNRYGYLSDAKLKGLGRLA